jgi:multisubunit Na+/H+ antiporter MnhB subunit
MSESICQSCTQCGYQTPWILDRCPICEGVMIESGESVTAFAAESNPRTFSLATLFMVMTFICVGLGALVAAPGLAVPMIVIGVPALVRTAAVGRIDRSQRREWTWKERFSAFAISAVIMVLIAALSGVAFFTACLFGLAASHSRGAYFAVGSGLALGAFAAVACMGFFIWFTWPKRESPRRGRRG